MKTHTLRDMGWYERTDRGLIYVYLTNGDRVRLAKFEARKIGELANK